MANDPRTPKGVKFLILGGIGFTLIPQDWLPEWMPTLSLADDAAIIPAVVAFSTLFIPAEVKRDHSLEAPEQKAELPLRVLPVSA